MIVLRTEIERALDELISNEEGMRFQGLAIVLSREDIITDLMLPGNASVCGSHLGIVVSVEAALAEVVAKTQAAASEVIRTWAAHPRLAGRPRIALSAMKLDYEGGDAGETL